MKKIFLDFGANLLQGLSFFQSKLNIDESWVIQSYEANRNIFEQVSKDITHPNYRFFKYENFKLYNCAISDSTGSDEIKNIVSYSNNGQKFFGDAGGSTLLKDVVWHQKDVEYKTDIIPTVDVNEILNDLYTLYGKDMEIYIKCDVEGYEYKVIRRLLQSQYIGFIKQIYIEWHPHFFENVLEKKAEAFDLLSRLNYLYPEMFVSMHC